ncbi:MAG: hypothetical protein HY696_01475 [Deltaproteobacteria bacterium]|nr:hypothetical protein [Deltaproteobacteria bacterium]
MCRRVSLLLLLMLALLIGCQRVEVYGELDQAEAHEILVLLNHSGLAAKLVKETRQNETFYGVTVDSDDLDQARALLTEHNLPRKKKQGLADVFQQPGFIPTPQEQKARFLLALKGEIETALEKVPDVVETHVVLNIPSQEDFASDAEPQKPSASVVLKVRPTEQSTATLTEEKIQRFVANAVEKLDPRDVSVILTYTGAPSGGILPGQSLILPPAAQGGAAGTTAATKSGSGAAADADTTTIAGMTMNSASVGRLKLYLGIFLALLAGLALGLIVMVVQASRMREQIQQQALPPAAPPPQLQAGE